MNELSRRQILLAGGACAVALFTATPAAQAVVPTPYHAGANRVTFFSAGEKMVGDLYVPAGAEPGAKLPAVVVVGPWLNVKEQVATNYAKKLAQSGYVALVFDFRYFGESGGLPREYESPAAKVADIKAATAWLKEQGVVDPGRIGALGVCFGAGYVAAATADDKSVRSMATVAAWIHDVPTYTQFVGADEVARRRQVGTEAMTAWREKHTVNYVPAASGIDKTAAMFAVDYYEDETRGAGVKQWKNQYAVMSWNDYIDFEALKLAPKVSVPLLMVHSDDSALPENVRTFYKNAGGPKSLFWTQGKHTDFYDREPYVSRAAGVVAAYFAETLGKLER